MTSEVEKNTPGDLLAARRHQNLRGLNKVGLPIFQKFVSANSEKALIEEGAERGAK